MKNIRNDFEMIKAGENTKLRVLAIELATREGSKTYNKSSKIGLAIAYIVTELSAHGQMKDIRREDIEAGSTAFKTDANNAVKKLVDKGLVRKYKKVNQVVNKRNKPTGEFRFDKYIYTLIATDELLDMIEAKGYTVSFDRTKLSKLQAEAASETEKVTSVIKVDKNGVETTETTTTDARGNRTKETSVDMDSVERALENAKEEYENKVSAINAKVELDGKQEELSPVQPLVSQEDILIMDIEEFKSEQQEAIEEDTNEEGVEGFARYLKEKYNGELPIPTTDEEVNNEIGMEEPVKEKKPRIKSKRANAFGRKRNPESTHQASVEQIKDDEEFDLVM